MTVDDPSQYSRASCLSSSSPTRQCSQSPTPRQRPRPHHSQNNSNNRCSSPSTTIKPHRVAGGEASGSRNGTAPSDTPTPTPVQPKLYETKRKIKVEYALSTPPSAFRNTPRTYSPSPTPRNRRGYSTSDRFIPDTTCTANAAAEFSMIDKSNNKRKASTAADLMDDDPNSNDNRRCQVIKNELFGYDHLSTPTRNRIAPSLFSYTSPAKVTKPHTMDHHLYNPSPISRMSTHVILQPSKPARNLSTDPVKVLDAPELQDDFYLNVVDWSTSDLLAVGLGKCVYLWSSRSGKVTKLCDLGPVEEVTSVSWMTRGTHLAVGTSQGSVQIWDVAASRNLRTVHGHAQRVGNLTWNDHTLTSGSRDRVILHRDVREAEHWYQKLTAHSQEICGLKWGPDGKLASGGNDNKLFVWDVRGNQPLYRFNEHTAAVKAIAWSPHQNGVLASGGGTQDRHIRFWNTHTGNLTSAHDTGSQVCNLAWSKQVNELVSTHGYSKNQVIVWKASNMAPVVHLSGHTSRVLYLAMSPDGQTIVTGAGDETLRFWQVFPERKPVYKPISLLAPASSIR